MDFNTGRNPLYRELDSDEKLVWSGKPDPKFFLISNIAPFLFGIPFFSFAMFWTIMAFSLTSKAEGTPQAVKILFPLFGIPFILVGGAFLLSPLWGYKRGKNTWYGITDKRLIILTGNRKIKVKSYYKNDISGYSKSVNQRGKGSIYFTRESYPAKGGRTSFRKIGFLGIENVKYVEGLIFENIISENNED